MLFPVRRTLCVARDVNCSRKSQPATASAAESTAAVMDESVEKSAGSSTLSAGAIIGVVIGGIALLVVAGGLFW